MNVFNALCTGTDGFSRAENERRGFRGLNAKDESREMFWIVLRGRQIVRQFLQM